MADDKIQSTVPPSADLPSVSGQRAAGQAGATTSRAVGLQSLSRPLLILLALVGIAVLQILVLGTALGLGRLVNSGDTQLLALFELGGFAVLWGIFYLIERKFWLSRLLGLHVPPGKGPTGRALIWALGGPLALLGYILFVGHEPQPTMEEQTKITHLNNVDSIREIAETIVFVVVLVLLLKSFVAEAFVIPTGSMAETLYGNQKLLTCPECGYLYPVNCSREAEAKPGEAVLTESGTCPNCRRVQKLKFSVDAYGRRVPDDPCHSGDRVLVAKFLYDLPWRSPERLNVVVFKFPGDSDAVGAPFPESGPSKDYTPINYIKRLIGLGGETIAICNGKLYVLSAADSAEWVKQFEANNPEQVEQNPVLRWRRRNMYEDYSGAKELFRDGKFTIIRKSPSKILSMSRVVNVNDNQPADLKGLMAARWEKDGAWNSDDQKKYTSAGGTATGWLRYANVLRDNHGKKSLITDFIGYNSGDGSPTEHWVGDLIVTCEVKVEKAEGEFLLELSKGVDRFRAIWDLKTGVCRLVRVEDYTPEGKKAGDAGVELKQQATSLKGPGTYKVRLANVDDRLTVWVDGKLPFDDGVEYSSAHKLGASQAPTGKNDLEPASIGVRGASVTVDHLRLDRDTYYTTDAHSDRGLNGIDPTNPEGWKNAEALTNPPSKTLYVQPGHYLCLGDNSPASSDGRTWGLVPDRLLLGRALVIYYPFKLTWPVEINPVNRVGPIH
jgi:signal peptidase I